MKQEFCIVHADYVVEGEGRDAKPVIRLWGRTKEGKTILVLDREFRPYFYAQFEGDAKELHSRIMQLEMEGERPVSVEPIQRNVLGKTARSMKITVTKPPSVPKFRDLIKEWEDIKEEYEYTIPFHKRYLIDKGLRPMCWVEIEGREVKYNARADTVMEASKIAPCKNVWVMLDVFKVMALSIGSANGKPADGLAEISLADNQGFSKRIQGDEKQVLEGFVSAVNERDPDFIIGYDSDRNDFSRMNAKSVTNKVRLAVGRDGSPAVFEKRGHYSSADIAGRAHIDLLDFVENILSSSLSSEILALQNVAGELLALPAKSKKSSSIDDAKLILKLGGLLLPQIFEISQLVGQLPFDSSRMAYSQLVESLLMREAFESGEIILNRPKTDEIAKRRKAASYEGGYVHPPVQGIHDNIALFDFASLYPSITITHNISPETLDCDDGCKDNEKARVPGLDHYFCVKKTGFIPRVLKRLVEKRVELKVLMKKEKKGSAVYNELYNRQYAMKIIANASYGYYGYPGSRWYSRIAAECITAWGRHYIKEIIGLAQKMGYHVIYGDTDSLFLKVKNSADAKRFLYKGNSTLPGVMELDFQGIYKSGIFVAAKTGAAAKKRYALMDSKGSLIIRGFEKVRRDWSAIARDTQEAVLIHILRDKSRQRAVNAVRKSVARLEKGQAKTDELVINTQLTKPLSEYEQIGPHVAAARKMEKAGIQVGEGSNIAYIIVKGEGSISDRAEPAETAKGYDPDYYINNQVLPAALRVLSVFGCTEEDLLGKGQPSLASFAKPRRRPRS